MDFLKTLLAYVGLTVAFSVQDGPLPQEVPTPTPLPPSVTATLAPNQTEVPTATPEPTAEPEPTITPNMSYKTVQWKDRGNDVLKLQRRLIELGYLDEGEDDGAYGSKTTSAVRRFQKANGLGVDGIAGQSTQTRLYEDPNVIPYSPPTVPPTATPTPTLAPTETPTVSASDDLPQPSTAPVVTETVAPVTLPESGLKMLDNGNIILGNSGSSLTFSVMTDGVGYTRRPGLWVDADGQAIMSLTELVQCIDDWTLTENEDGTQTFAACGYTITLQNIEGDLVAMLDGASLPLGVSDLQLRDGDIYISQDFLSTAIQATVIFDLDERSLILFVTNKSVNSSAD